MSLMIAGASVALALGASAIAQAKRRAEKKEGIHSDVWATLGDVRRWGLIGDQKVDGRGWPVPAFVYGSMSERSDIVFDWTTEETSRHALISAPTGAGKTWTVFYPTLLYGWTHSAVVHVRKRELAEWTAGFRSTWSDVIWLDPTSMGSAKYNPLDRIRATGIFAIRDSQNFMERLASAGGSTNGGENAVFLETAKDFAAASVVFVLTHFPMSRRNPSGLRAAFADCAGLATAMMSNEHPDPRVQAELKVSANALLSNPSERFIGNVEGLMRSWLRVYQDTVLAHVTSRSDFSPSDLVRGDRPATLYIHLPPSDDRRLAPFVNILIADIIDELMTREKTTRDGSPKNWKVALILDEAWRLGKIEALEGALADMRSYGIRALLGVQGLSQVIDLYGLHNSVFNNCRWITSWQNGFDECKRVADMLGDAERTKKSTSTTFGPMGDFRGRSASTALEWRPVIHAAHVSRIPKDRIIIFGEEKPILAYRTHKETWRPLVRPLHQPERMVGEFLTGPNPGPGRGALPYLTRLIEGFGIQTRLPPPGHPEPPKGPPLLPPPAGPKPGGDDGKPKDQPKPGRRGRRRLF